MIPGLLFVIGDYTGFITEDDHVSITRTLIQDEQEAVTLQKVDGIFEFMNKAKQPRIHWAKYEDDFEVISLYDEATMYGYGMNLQRAWDSEWGSIYTGE